MWISGFAAGSPFSASKVVSSIAARGGLFRAADVDFGLRSPGRRFRLHKWILAIAAREGLLWAPDVDFGLHSTGCRFRFHTSISAIVAGGAISGCECGFPPPQHSSQFSASKVDFGHRGLRRAFSGSGGGFLAPQPRSPFLDLKVDFEHRCPGESFRAPDVDFLLCSTDHCLKLQKQISAIEAVGGGRSFWAQDVDFGLRSAGRRFRLQKSILALATRGGIFGLRTWILASAARVAVYSFKK